MERPRTTKSILFLTGTRADFGKLKPLIEQVERSDEFEARIFATGMHMLSRYGKTIQEIQKAGFKHIYGYINQDGAVNSQMDLVLANTVQGLGHYVRESLPDMILVHGDRIEALAGAIVGALANVRVAHVEGGEVSGTVDELIRHAVTKMSHLHFVANEDAKRRLVQMGESEDAIFVIGSADIDVMLSEKLPELPEVVSHYEIPFSDYALCIFHPVTTELADLRRQTQEVVAALEATHLNLVVIYPNNDTGSDVILQAYAALEGHPRLKFIPSMRFEYFLSLLKHAKAIIGNSSAGIREAPVYGVPTVNIGSRQMNRFEYPSIINVAPDKEAILKAIEKLPTDVRPSLHFGKGDSAVRFLAHLRDPATWRISPQKQFKDILRTSELDETVLT